MGRLGGFKYREIIKRLKYFGFEFYRQAAGSHEIWYNSKSKNSQQSLTTLEICQKVH